MNNISFPKNWGKKEINFVELHWHKCAIREPQEKDLYLITVGNEGIKNFVMVSSWLGDRWDNELIGDIVAWAHFPAPYEQAE